jgi:hypothetical protein
VSDGFAGALRAEHAAVYAYGALGARLGGNNRPLAYAGEVAHRSRRDALVIRMTAAAETPPPAEPGYAMEPPLTDAASALRLAVAVEERTALAWNAVLAEVTGDDRALALDALTDCALRAFRWRRAAGVEPGITAFPGRR